MLLLRYKIKQHTDISTENYHTQEKLIVFRCWVNLHPKVSWDECENETNREMKEKVNICLYLFLDAHERPTLRFPVLLYLLNPLYPLHLKPLLPVLPAAVKIFKKFRLRDLQSIFFILLKRSNSEFMWIFASISSLATWHDMSF